MKIYIVGTGIWEDWSIDKVFIDKKLAEEYASRIEAGNEYVNIVEHEVTETLEEYDGRIWSISAETDNGAFTDDFVIDDMLIGNTDRPVEDILNEKRFDNSYIPNKHNYQYQEMNVLSEVGEDYFTFRDRAYNKLRGKYWKWVKEQNDNSK